MGTLSVVCRCGISHSGINATQVNRAWKTASGADCCSWGTQFDGTNDDVRRTTQFTGAVDSSRMTLAMCFYVTGSVASDTMISLSSNGLSPALTGSFNASSQLTISVSDGPGANTYSIRSSSGFIPAFPSQFTTVLCSIDTNFPAGSKLGHLYINDSSNVSLIGDAAPAFNIDWTQNRFTHCIGATLAAASRCNVIMVGLYLHQGVYMDFSVEANRRFFFTPDNTPTCNWITSNNGTYASGSQPKVLLIDPFATYNTNYGDGGALTVTGALTGGISPCDTVPGFDVGGGEAVGEGVGEV